jgi:uncharacterized membrane protein YedE/YeeE
VAFGFTLSRAGFTDWGETNRMLRFADLRLVLAFAGAVGVAMAGFLALARHDELPRNPLRRATLPGAVLFGAGWAVAGCCPAVTLVQIGEGRVAGVASLAGVLGGAWLHRRLSARFGWGGGSCGG